MEAKRWEPEDEVGSVPDIESETGWLDVKVRHLNDRVQAALNSSAEKDARIEELEAALRDVIRLAQLDCVHMRHSEIIEVADEALAPSVGKGSDKPEKDFTPEEAIAEARKRWGEKGWVMFQNWGDEDWAYYHVGIWGYGEGRKTMDKGCDRSWKAAFAAADSAKDKGDRG